MNEKIIRMLTATDHRAAQNCVVWSHARQEYLKVDGSRSTAFHVELDGCYEQRTTESRARSEAARSLNKYSQGTQTAHSAVHEALLCPEASATGTFSGQVSRSVLYDLYLSDFSRRSGRSGKTGKVANDASALESALRAADRL